MMMAHDRMSKSGDKRNRVNEELDLVRNGKCSSYQWI